MDGYDARFARLTARQHGAVARWQTPDVPRHAWDVRTRSGVLVAMHHGVYRLRGAPFTQELRWSAAVLAGGPTARLSHLAGAALLGLDVRKVRPQITVDYGGIRDIPGVDVHRTRRGGDVIVVNGIRVTNTARTVLDVATSLDSRSYATFVEDAVTSGKVKVESLLAVLDRQGGRGVEGSTALRAVLLDGLADDRIQRKLELLLARIIRSCPVPEPTRQHELTCTDGRAVVLDNAWVDQKIAVEAVGLRWHGNKAQAARTRARARSITATGWTHYEYGWSDATDGIAQTRAEITRICAGSAGSRPADPAQNEDETGEAAA